MNTYLIYVTLHFRDRSGAGSLCYVQKSRQNHRSYVWREAPLAPLFGLVFVSAQKLCSTAWCEHNLRIWRSPEKTGFDLCNKTVSTQLGTEIVGLFFMTLPFWTTEIYTRNVKLTLKSQITITGVFGAVEWILKRVLNNYFIILSYWCKY